MLYKYYAGGNRNSRLESDRAGKVFEKKVGCFLVVGIFGWIVMEERMEGKYFDGLI